MNSDQSLSRAKGLFDSHAHYYDPRFSKEYPGGADAILAAFRNGGIEGVINIGTNLKTSEACLDMAGRYDFMHASVGIHPEDCHGIHMPVDDAIRTIEDMAVHNRDKVVAIGEIGLDYYRDSYEGVPLNKTLEKEYFDKQLTLSEKLSLPAVVHDRDAHGDCMDMILSHPKSFGVFHSFSGSLEMARELIKRGWYISFTGVITFKNAVKFAGIIPAIPEDRLLVETDCPYLAPHPFRGMINHSALMAETVQKIAELRGTSYEHIAQVTCENAKRLFRIP